jgi:hypothetical protein
VSAASGCQLLKRLKSFRLQFHGACKTPLHVRQHINLKRKMDLQEETEETENE